MYHYLLPRRLPTPTHNPTLRVNSMPLAFDLVERDIPASHPRHLLPSQLFYIEHVDGKTLAWALTGHGDDDALAAVPTLYCTVPRTGSTGRRCLRVPTPGSPTFLRCAFPIGLAMLVSRHPSVALSSRCAKQWPSVCHLHCLAVS